MASAFWSKSMGSGGGTGCDGVWEGCVVCVRGAGGGIVDVVLGAAAAEAEAVTGLEGVSVGVMGDMGGGSGEAERGARSVETVRAGILDSFPLIFLFFLRMAS